MSVLLKICVVSLSAFFILVTWKISASEDQPANETAVRKTLATYTESWNKHDMKVFATVFAPDCDYVNIGGVHWIGLEENVRQHTRLFQERLAGVVQNPTNVQIRFPRPEVALVHTNWDVTGYTRPDGEKVDVLKEITTMVLIKADGKWLITAFQNTEVRSQTVVGRDATR